MHHEQQKEVALRRITRGPESLLASTPPNPIYAFVGRITTAADTRNSRRLRAARKAQ
jgi:hypothetical protein